MKHDFTGHIECCRKCGVTGYDILLDSRKSECLIPKGVESLDYRRRMKEFHDLVNPILQRMGFVFNDRA